jgi:hypothetical protein
LGAAPALADVVTLKDGSKREGKVVSEDNDEVVLEVAQGRLKAQLILKRSEVTGIEKGPTANEKLVAEVAARRAKLGAKDAEAWLEFARWLDGLSGFSADARAAYEKVVAIDPDNAAARTKLGYQKVGGQWMTEDEVMAAKGLVRYAGKWVTPEEKANAMMEDAKRAANIRIALAEEIAKERADKIDADAKAREQWLKDMQALAAEKAARYQAGGVYAEAESGGVVVGTYGQGYYGVRTSTGEYIPFVPYTAPYYYYTGTAFGCGPVVVTTSPRRVRYVTVPSSFVRYTDKHWSVQIGGGGTTVKVVK